jgi:hypothetical protein
MTTDDTGLHFTASRTGIGFNRYFDLDADKSRLVLLGGFSPLRVKRGPVDKL